MFARRLQVSMKVATRQVNDVAIVDLSGQIKLGEGSSEWLYIQKEELEIPSLYFSHDRVCIERGDMSLAHTDCVGLKPGETPQSLRVRFRTIGDMTCTGAVLSEP